MDKEEDKNKRKDTINYALGISDARECIIINELNKLTEGEEHQIADYIKEIEAWDDSFSRIEKTYAIFLLGEAVGETKAKEEEKTTEAEEVTMHDLAKIVKDRALGKDK